MGPGISKCLVISLYPGALDKEKEVYETEINRIKEISQKYF
jgi:hypothetical protein